MILWIGRVSGVVFSCSRLLPRVLDVFDPRTRKVLDRQESICGGDASLPESVLCEPLPETARKKQGENNYDEAEEPSQGGRGVRFHESSLSGAKAQIMRSPL